MHRRQRFDVIYGCELVPDGVAALLLGRELQIPVMISSIGSDAHAHPYLSDTFMRRTRWVVRGADVILVEGEGAAGAVQALVPETLPIRAFNRGIDLERYEDIPSREEMRLRLGLPADGRLIVFLGRLLEGKGICVLLDVFGRLQSEFADIELVIVGGGSLDAWLARKVADVEWGHKIHALGLRSFKEVPQVLSACDLFCLPSFAEGLPKSVIEAMAAGLPVVATSVGGIPDVVRDGVSGFLVPPRDAGALERALSALLLEPEQAGRMGQLNRDTAFERYDANRNAAQLLEFAGEAMSRASKRAQKPLMGAPA
jgi:glycosyltransferase involved in cell wall biosynthesis